ncbi:MAG: hypothetical protein IT349_21365 [Candidatus Eisenbacteria bacterium]|nr:hypothetical protein [Candidatus Eisenbacteria bacterium]
MAGTAHTAGGERPGGIADKIGRIPRRAIFVVIALSVIIPLFLRLVFPIKPSPIVEHIFDRIEALPPGSRILLSLDYSPSTAPENHPMASAVARHALERDCQLYIMSLWATGPIQCSLLADEVIKAEFADKQEGVDWINLGYRAGNQGLINAILLDLKAMFNTDAGGRAIDQSPMMREVRNLKDMDLIVAIGSGVPGVKEWVQFAGDRGNIPIAGGVTAVEAPLLYPYYPQQLLGLMGGLQGAAEYESALIAKYPRYRETGSTAVRLMGPQAVAHTVIILLVILGNTAYVIERRRKKGMA